MSNTPSPSTIRRLGPGLAGVAAVLGATYIFYSTRAPHMPGPPNPFKTPGVGNIEKAYSNGGATKTHTPAYGGTVQGKREDESRVGGVEGKMGGPNHEDVGEQQRPDQATRGAGEKWNEMKYGSSTQK